MGCTELQRHTFKTGLCEMMCEMWCRVPVDYFDISPLIINTDDTALQAVELQFKHSIIALCFTHRHFYPICCFYKVYRAHVRKHASPGLRPRHDSLLRSGWTRDVALRGHELVCLPNSLPEGSKLWVTRMAACTENFCMHLVVVCRGQVLQGGLCIFRQSTAPCSSPIDHVNCHGRKTT